MATLGELERTVMNLLWESGTAVTANSLRDRLASQAQDGASGKDLAVTTVLTVLSRLERKNLVEREREIRPHRYRALTTRADHTAELMHEVLGSVQDRDAVLTRFIGSVSETEAETLRKLLGGSKG
ncbi:BlaI/MecI/CopY family transcriptional regulator [Arthrobacter roseus]|uniref:BlaI/MecI/CopY family transcriptional regulator n=1 Tax=Arthrobacter roseus TaxID=136274 RepID=UPI0019629184|nr:BlaI/MecI/CopY family transcriptional regulator [Arthrobacter roseus]MBM7848375.1 putative transcriptional regulator [Arthrobacter roseus]